MSKENIYAFTSAAANYLPKARQLCKSIKHYHPEFTVCLALADEVPGSFKLNDEPFDAIIPVADLDIPDLRSWIFRHSLVELCTAIKPFALRKLLSDKDITGVLYFDPDMVLFSRLDDLKKEFDHSSILLTPHITRPEKTLEAIIDNEICTLRHGLYNLGFIGVNNDENGNNFTEWWCQRCGHFNFDEIDNGLFVDQRWVDLVPIFFDRVKILLSSRFNVATWNLTTRKLEGNMADNFLVDGQPLGFYHFTGFDSGAHEGVAAKYFSGNKSVRSLIQWYKSTAQNEKESEKLPWAYDTFENGAQVNPAHRVIYRRRQDLQKAFRDPFRVVKDGPCYYDWFLNQAAVEYPEFFRDLPGGNQSSLIARRPPQGLSTSPLKWYRISTLSYYLSNTLRLLKLMFTILRNEGFRGLDGRLK